MQSIEVIFMPHPPVAVPELRRGQGFRMESTIKGYEAMAKKIAHIHPETIIYISPHGHSFSNGICILDETNVTGNLSAFGHEEVSVHKSVDRELNTMIGDVLDEHDMISLLLNHSTASQYGIDVVVDHGALVPMDFIDKVYAQYQLVHMTPSGQDLLSHYRLGVYLREAIERSGKKVVVICSGDLSHALKEEGPYKFNEFGPVFDQMVVKAIQSKDPLPLIELSPEKEAASAQCGLKSFIIGFGLMDGNDYTSEVVSYEGPFGVGYLTGYLANDFLSVRQSLLEILESKAEQAYQIKLEQEDAYVKLARKTIEHYVTTHRRIMLKAPPTYMDQETYEELLGVKAGAFVSIHKEGRLRGCIGTTAPSTSSLMEEIIYCAISACSSDPRFNPVDLTELKQLEIKVDRLYEPERIYDLDELDVVKYGVIVEQGRDRGLLLPNLEGVTTIEDQVRIAKEKAGIVNDDNLVYYRFEVERHH